MYKTNITTKWKSIHRWTGRRQIVRNSQGVAYKGSHDPTRELNKTFQSTTKTSTFSDIFLDRNLELHHKAIFNTVCIKMLLDNFRINHNRILVTLLLVEATCLFSDPFSNISHSSSFVVACITTERSTNTRPWKYDSCKVSKNFLIKSQVA